MNKNVIDSVNRAIEIAGSTSDLAEKCGVTRAAIYNWRSGYRLPCPQNAIKIEKATDGKVTRSELCPSINW